MYKILNINRPSIPCLERWGSFVTSEYDFHHKAPSYAMVGDSTGNRCVATNARFKKAIGGKIFISKLQEEIFSLAESGGLLRVEQVGHERGIILGAIGDLDGICKCCSVVDELKDQAIENIARRSAQ